MTAWGRLGSFERSSLSVSSQRPVWSRPGAAGDPRAACREWPVRGSETGKLSQKRALALADDRRFNRLQNNPVNAVTRPFRVIYGKDRHHFGSKSYVSMKVPPSRLRRIRQRTYPCLSFNWFGSSVGTSNRTRPPGATLMVE